MSLESIEKTVKSDGRHIGDNVTLLETPGGHVLFFARDGNFGPSKSGKTKIVASTRGNTRIGDAKLVLGLTVFEYLAEKD